VTGEPGKKLAALLLENAPPDDLLGARQTLAQLVEDRLAFLNERKPGGEDCGRQSGWRAGGITAIDIVNDDMPFLVDSTIALAERGRGALGAPRSWR
jgi:NAD-specific glutamate dehydrogenase